MLRLLPLDVAWKRAIPRWGIVGIVGIVGCCLTGGCIFNPFGNSNRADRSGDALKPPPNFLASTPSAPAQPIQAAPRPILVTVDLSTPKAAAMTYYRAMSFGDAGAARAAVLGDDLTNHYIDATTAFSATVRDLYTALAARFGRDAARSNPEFLAHLEDFASADVPRAIATGEVRLSGDTATLTLHPVGAYPGNEGAPAVFKRVGNRWKLAMLASRRLDGLQAQEAVELTVDQRRSAERLALLARNLRSGRYGNIEQVWAGEGPAAGALAARSPAAGSPAAPSAPSATRTQRPLAMAHPSPGAEMPTQPAPVWTAPVPHPATPWLPRGATRATAGTPAPAETQPAAPPATSPAEATSPPSRPAIASASPRPAAPEAVRPETAPTKITATNTTRPAVADTTPPTPPSTPARPASPAPPASPRPPAAPAPVAPAAPAPPAEVSAAVAAIRQAHLEMARNKLAKGADVNAKDVRGRTMLHDAAIAGEDELVKFLLSKGADVKLIDSQGWTALDWAASGGHASVVKLLLDAGADPNLRDQIGATPLHWAAIFDQKEVAGLLIDRGADVKAQDIQGKTPLHAAAEHDALQTAALLIAKGANLKAKDEDGYTPLHDVIQHARAALADLSQTEPDAGGATPAAATSGGGPRETRRSILKQSAEMIELLLANGADVNVRTPRGQTPLHLAAWDDTRDLAALLVARGADTDAQDSKGRTPLEMARQRGQKKAVQVLGGKAEGG